MHRSDINLTQLPKERNVEQIWLFCHDKPGSVQKELILVQFSLTISYRLDFEEWFDESFHFSGRQLFHISSSFVSWNRIFDIDKKKHLVHRIVPVQRDSHQLNDSNHSDHRYHEVVFVELVKLIE